MAEAHRYYGGLPHSQAVSYHTARQPHHATHVASYPHVRPSYPQEHSQQQSNGTWSKQQFHPTQPITYSIPSDHHSNAVYTITAADYQRHHAAARKTSPDSTQHVQISHSTPHGHTMTSNASSVSTRYHNANEVKRASLTEPIKAFTANNQRQKARGKDQLHSTPSSAPKPSIPTEPTRSLYPTGSFQRGHPSPAISYMQSTASSRRESHGTPSPDPFALQLGDDQKVAGSHRSEQSQSSFIIKDIEPSPSPMHMPDTANTDDVDHDGSPSVPSPSTTMELETGRRDSINGDAAPRDSMSSIPSTQIVHGPSLSSEVQTFHKGLQRHDVALRTVEKTASSIPIDSMAMLKSGMVDANGKLSFVAILLFYYFAI